MKISTRQDRVATLQDIRLGDLPVALYAPIADLLAEFVEGTLYDDVAGGVSQKAMKRLEARLGHALESVTPGEMPEELRRLAEARIEHLKRANSK
jgi:hypothetical protein